jgi:uncharacterized protein (DUF2147 family)
MIRMRFVALFRCAFAMTAMVFADVGVASADPIGLWLARDGAHVNIVRCGKDLCGVLASTKSPSDPATGRPWTDKNNPDPRLQSHPLVGVRVLVSMRPNGVGKWSGQLYNTNDGNTYAGNLIEIDRQTVRVEGCALGICNGENMTRIK